MRAHMTTGTWDFLQRRIRKHEQFQFFRMDHPENHHTLIYYETNVRKRSIFSGGRSYEILRKRGEIEERGYFVMQHIPLTKEGGLMFKQQMERNDHFLEEVEGLIAYRLLKTLRGHTFVIFTQWKEKSNYKEWWVSKERLKIYDEKYFKKPAYVASRPFFSYYSFDDEEDEKNKEKWVHFEIEKLEEKIKKLKRENKALKEKLQNLKKE